MFLNVSYPSICRTARCFAWSCTERIQSSRDAFASSRDTFGGAFDIAADDRPEPARVSDENATDGLRTV